MIIPFSDIHILAQHIVSKYKRTVIVGGCFDILHIGHIHFLQKAKESGDVLIVLLESDSSVKKRKGHNRPVNSQLDRAEMLSEFKTVDYVILLPAQTTTEDYLEVTRQLKPAIIATTNPDPFRNQKEACAKLVGAKVIDVIKREPERSTSRITFLLENKNTI